MNGSRQSKLTCKYPRLAVKQEVVTDSAARRQLCVRICGHTRNHADCSNGAAGEESAAAESADSAPNGALEGAAAAAGGMGEPDLAYQGVLERTAGLPVHALPGVEVITDMWAFKRRQGLLASPK